LEIAIKKVGQRDGVERFILVNNKTRQVITVSDVSESSLRRFFSKRAISEDAIKSSFTRARKRYEEASKSSRRLPVDQTADTIEGDDLLFQLGLGEDGGVRP
jgi:hypothetical protein